MSSSTMKARKWLLLLVSLVSALLSYALCYNTVPTPLILLVTVLIVSSSSVAICIAQYWCRFPQSNLPPGSMGLPIIGETWEFFKPHSLYGIPPFVKERVERYGRVFKTRLVGRNVIISTEPDVNHRIFMEENKSVLIWYTESFMRVMGEKGLLGNHGLAHKYLKNLLLGLVGPVNLKDDILKEMNAATLRYLEAWADRGTVDVKEGTAELIFQHFAYKLMSYSESGTPLRLRQKYINFIEGLIAFPLNVPGTAFYKCLKGRKEALKIIRDIFENRIASGGRRGDFLDNLIDEMNKGNLEKEVIIELVFVLLFAAYETTSEAITLMVKFISDKPTVLSELMEEHARFTHTSDSGISWEEYKGLHFTNMVINESVRLANIVPGIFRKVIKEIQINEFTIPAGWIVMVVPSSVHLSENHYEDPLLFNPWRWQGQDMHAGSKSFMAFGGGSRLCAGADFAKLQMAIFLNHLMTRYRWSVVKGGNICRKPGLVFPDGLHIALSRK